MKARWPITLMCEVLEVSASGYFSWEAAGRRPERGPGRSHSDEALLAHIRAIHEQLRGEYGWPRMHKELLARGLRVDDFQDTLKAWGVLSSMSRKGNCWDNAPTESLWGRLKTACVHGRRFATREQATLVGGAAQTCRLMTRLCTPGFRGSLSSGPTR
jgi:hypothetical protein